MDLESRYDTDPRVVWVNERMATVPDDQGGEWVVFHHADLWFAHDPRGEVCPEASCMETVDDAVYALIGDPMWVVEGQLLTQAAEPVGWLAAGGVEVSHTGKLVMAGMITNSLFLLVDGQRPHARYVLTEDGEDFAQALLRGPSEEEAKALLDGRRVERQRHT